MDSTLTSAPNPERRGGNKARLCAFVLGLACVVSGRGVAAENELAGNPSPYLALHSVDPVNWRTWSEEALAEARREDKLILVASGYFSCHWCHVMQAENFQNDAVARVLNDNFVSIVVDRELQPALDAYLVEFVQATNGHAGWPLHVFLTPEGHPLVGMTYMPRERFTDIVDQIIARWRDDKDELKKVAAQAAEIIQRTHATQERREISKENIEPLLEAFRDSATRLADELNGGFGDTAKFPSVPQLSLLLRLQRVRPQAERESFLALTFERMATQGLRDQLGGGFFRYVTDPGWQIPHFEKMLYDNALLTELYLDAAQVLRNPKLAQVAQDTVDFMLRELWEEPAGFISSLSAVDDNAVEGGYYLWSSDGLSTALTPDELAAAAFAWRLTGAPSLPDGYLPVQHETPQATAEQLGIELGEAQARLESARVKLLAKRHSERTAPRDAKVLAGWNGLALGALVGVFQSTGDDKYKHAAQQLKDYFATELWNGQRLVRATGKRGEFGNATLQDYAFAARGLLAFAELSGADTDFELVSRIVAKAWEQFRSAEGWRLADDILIPYAIAEPSITDGALPSPSALLIDASLRLAKHTDDQALAKRARAALRQGTTAMTSSPYFYASQVAGLFDHMLDDGPAGANESATRRR